GLHSGGGPARPRVSRAMDRGKPMAIENPDRSMKDKTCLVTGATSGIGEITARELARLGARVIIVGRSPERCAATSERIRAQTGATAVESMVADLSFQAD